MLKGSISVLFSILFLVGQSLGWDFDYININPEQDVTDVTFRLYSTKYVYGDDTYKDILFDEETGEASLEDVWFYNSSIPTKIVAHGNGGGLKLDQFLWKNYTEVADEVSKHYNIIGIRWGKGNEKRHAWTGIKTAKVVKSFVEKYGLKISEIHGIGFSYGAHVINAMATELNDIGFGKIDRLTLLDPGSQVPVRIIDGKEQYGLVHKDDASFVDVFHTSTTGIWQMAVGDVDSWVNGGKAQPPNMYPGSHKASVFAFSRTILMTSFDECLYVAWQCVDPEWSSFAWKDRNEKDTCDFGNPDSENAIQYVGEYIYRGEPFLTTGNFIFFTNEEYGYCEDLDCDMIC